MSSTDRQNKLLISEDWKRVYQSFKNADFQSYDFDNLRRTMINYLRKNYPEDFNDYIESSEYLALIDLIAYLGQNLAFRTDLNARENFLELAERRESVIRLARLLSYNPKRNQSANGLLKMESISTSEDIIDSNGNNLAGQTIVWNDVSNQDWYEQFIKVLNSALPANGVIGRPVKKDTVNGISAEQYRFNALNTDVPNFGFTKNISGRGTLFELVSTNIESNEILEEAPLPGNNFAFVYQDDGQGAGSNNTGFFSHFRQGSLDQGTFSISTPSTNQSVNLDAINVNDSDVWLYKLDTTGNETELWSKVNSVEGNNIVYNSLSKNIRNVYSVLTRVQDRISLIFSDGVFGTLPKGNFKVYYRASDNRSFVISPDEMTNINITIPYFSKTGTEETLTIEYELKYTVDNSAESESNDSIKSNAPSTYYTQNRMITGEDYNVAPLSVSQEIVKVKAVNRTSSGISRYFDLLDATGKYSKTNLYGKDGAIYTQYLDSKVNFTFTTRNDIQGTISTTVEPLLLDPSLRNFYYTKFPLQVVTDLNAQFVQVTKDQNISTGYLMDLQGVKYTVSTFTGSTLKYIQPGAMVKFVSPEGYHFMPNGTLMLDEVGKPLHSGATKYMWTKVAAVNGNGKTNYADGRGPIVFNDVVPTAPAGTNAYPVIERIIPKFATLLDTDIQTQMIDQIFQYKTFGLRYSVSENLWRLITESNLDKTSAFGMGKTGDTSNQQLDNSWMLLFNTDGETYTITTHGQRYVFESDKEIRFYFDSSDKVFDPQTNKIVKDKIRIMSINTQPGSTQPFTVPFDWEILQEYRDAEGYVDSKKIQIGFFDSDDDGVVDDPDMFTQYVGTPMNLVDKFVIQQKYTNYDGIDDYKFVSWRTATTKIVATENDIIQAGLSSYIDGTVFYIVDVGLFKVYNEEAETLTLTVDYRAYPGRDNIIFQYEHAADESNRIDPSSSNIIDVYMLTRSYDTLYRQWLQGAIPLKPITPTSDSLFTNYGSEINKIKSISDDVIYHPVKYKPLFGTSANTDLQATFKIVKNVDKVVNDNEVKANVVSAINRFFALENWDFGETFYFSELSTYIMNELAPNISSIVIVPNKTDSAFGSLFEIKAEADEIFINGSTVADVEIISAVTASKLKATGAVVTEIQDNTVSSVELSSSSSSSSSNSSSSSSGSSSSSSSSSSSNGGYSY